MSFSWLCFLILIAILSNYAQDRYKGSVVCKILLIILLAYITGFGGLTTSDHGQYVSIYKSYTSFADFEFSHPLLIGSDSAYESGYILLMIFCNIMGLGEAGFFFVIALIINGSLVYYIYRHKLPDVAIWAVFVSGFISIQTNIIRQSLALAIILLFIDCLSDGKYLKYIIGVALASLFHTSALFFLLFLPICFIKSEFGQNILNFVLIGLVIISLLIAFGLIKFDLLALMDSFSVYEKYLNTDNDVGGAQRLAHSVIFTVVSLLICLLYGRIDKQAAVLICFAAIVSNVAIAYPNLERFKCYFITLGYISLVRYFDLKQYTKKYEIAIMRGLRIVFAIYFISVISRTFIFTNEPPIFKEHYSFDKFFK